LCTACRDRDCGPDDRAVETGVVAVQGEAAVEFSSVEGLAPQMPMYLLCRKTEHRKDFGPRVPSLDVKGDLAASLRPVWSDELGPE